MEKLIMKKRMPVVRVRAVDTRDRRDSMQVLEPVNKPQVYLYYPPMKLPKQPQAYLKCREHDCL